MELFFLLGLLFVIVWLNRDFFGLGGNNCSWMGSDMIAEDGSRKWVCNKHGTVVVTKDGSTPPDCPDDHRNSAQG